MSLLSKSLSTSDGVGLPYAQQWEQLYQHWLEGTVDGALEIPDLEAATTVTHLYYWPLGAILFGRAYQEYGISPDAGLALFRSLSAKIKTILSSRWDTTTGLIFIQDPTESLLPDSDFWAQARRQRIADPAFLALLIHAIENLIVVGGAWQQDLRELIQYNELLIHSTNEYLWNETYGTYFPYDLEQNEQIVSDSIAGLLCWIADLPDQTRAEAMYRTLANNFVHPQHFYFPTNCVTAADQYRSVSLLVNYLLFFGLTRFDFGPTAHALRQHSQFLVEAYGVQPLFSSLRHPQTTTVADTDSRFLHSLWQDYQKLPLRHFSNRD